ncbi:MAG: protein kinase [Nitrospirae bacterium]|nr:protein kinase [Nitrospirota bacterium]
MATTQNTINTDNNSLIVQSFKPKVKPSLTSYSPQSIKDFISTIDGFIGLSSDVLDLIVENILIKKYHRGEYIVRHGEKGDTMYIIGDGEVIIPVIGEKFDNIVFLTTGAIFGEMSLLTYEDRLADVIAESKIVILLEIQRDKVELILKKSPQFGQFLTNLLRKRLKDNKVTDQYIGKYKVKGLLGTGATSDVYSVSNVLINKNLAIKVLNHSNLEKGHDLINEAKLMARLTHRNIIQVYDLQKVYGTIGIIMEELKGFALDTIISERKNKGIGFTYTEILSIIRQIAEGLSYVNSQGIIHRDIKPANCIHIVESDTIKIMDFGIADRINSNKLFYEEELKGTPSYIAPEIILARIGQSLKIDYRADIYSLGVIAYEMAAGIKPFDSDNLSEILKMHTDSTPDWSRLPEDLPDGLTKFIKGALIKDPETRLSDWEHIKYLLDTDLLNLHQEKLIDDKKEKTNNTSNDNLDTIRKSAESRSNMKGFIEVMSTIIGVNNPILKHHHQRVAILAIAIGKKMGITSNELEGLEMASMIHDIGMVFIPALILNKSDKLLDQEFDIIKEHPKTGYDLIKGIELDLPQLNIAQIIYQHHEKINGSGYPNGLLGDDILPLAKILCAADVLEAISSDKSYRKAQFMSKAIEEISVNKGILYDSNVVDACLELFTENIHIDIFG